jgi:uncharacterized protein
MQAAEKYRVLFFLSFIVIVYILAAATLIRLTLHRFGLLNLSFHPVQIWLRRIVIGLALGGILCIAYGYFIEPYWPSITHLQITSSKLLKNSQPIRIIHISDLHSDPKPRLEERLPALIANEKPDIIVFTGDSINSPEGLPIFKQCLSKLAAIAPTFVVRGNWDSWYWYNIKLFDGTGANELNGNALNITIKGNSVWIAGVAVDNERMMKQSLSSISEGAFTVFLYHYPDLINEVAEQKVDLFCAGHTHGGQIALPFYGALITFSKFGKQYEAGLYKVKDTWLYVNRGIGMEGGSVPRVRFNARPEITVIDVSPAE